MGIIVIGLSGRHFCVNHHFSVVILIAVASTSADALARPVSCARLYPTAAMGRIFLESSIQLDQRDRSSPSSSVKQRTEKERSSAEVAALRAISTPS